MSEQDRRQKREENEEGKIEREEGRRASTEVPLRAGRHQEQADRRKGRHRLRRLVPLAH